MYYNIFINEVKYMMIFYRTKECLSKIRVFIESFAKYIT